MITNSELVSGIKYPVSSNTKIRNFTDLVAWQKSHELALGIFNASKSFPPAELYGLTSQIRRAALSISSNVAEGFGRATKNDKKHFYTMAHASLTETQNQLIYARDISYLENAIFTELFELSVETNKLINGLIKSINAGNGVKP